MDPHSVVALFLRDGEDGKEVMAISRKGKLDDLGLIGGKVEPNEDPITALKREVQEEIGVEITQFEKVFERVDEVDGNVAWCYRVDSFEGDPSAREPGTWLGWVPFKGLLEPNCTFRGYNRSLFMHIGLLTQDDTEAQEDWEGFAPSLNLPHMSEDELRKFVLDFLGNRIFTDKHIHPGSYAQMVPMVFMPLALGALAKFNVDSLKQIGCIYEFVDKAGPSSINGYPIFFSFRMIHTDDWARAAAAIEREEKRREKIEV